MTLTAPRAVTVGFVPVLAAAGISPGLATLATWIVPAGADKFAPAIDTGPPTRPIVCPGLTPIALPLTVIAGGVAVRKPKAAGAAALNVLPLGLVA